MIVLIRDRNVQLGEISTDDERLRSGASTVAENICPPVSTHGPKEQSKAELPDVGDESTVAENICPPVSTHGPKEQSKTELPDVVCCMFKTTIRLMEWTFKITVQTRSALFPFEAFAQIKNMLKRYTTVHNNRILNVD
ncbi:hypothetical protein CLF_110979 [Clonorchis sinensis]|uniref:Uncharacterized protein n=1 Tax=Clonorchis sinensis TaxID=79923 RepID=G7YU53_CLOSI|nr:hypothetical protein CLF_110979 [Clonorchis sinensis]